MRLENLLVLQNKIDLLTFHQATENHRQISQFLQGTAAEKAPVVPISAQHCVNIDVVNAHIAKLPAPCHDLAAPPCLRVIRSFDVNKPGTDVESLVGGIAGGTVEKGILRKGMNVEIRPGLVWKDEALGEFVCRPLRTTIRTLNTEKTPLEYAAAGGQLERA